MRINPRITVPVHTPMGNVYLGANIRPAQRPARTQRAPYVQPQARPRTNRLAQPTMGPRVRRQPTMGDRLLVALGMVLVAFLALVAMALLAMATGVLPATPTTTPTPAPTHSVPATTAGQGHGVLARSSTGQ
jgi:hypothetical protein